MRELHPRRQRPQIRNEAVTTGINHDQVTYPESGYIRCSRCGQVLNKHRHPQGTGDGVTQVETQLNGAVLVNATSITVDSTTGFDSSGYVYIYDTGVVSSTTGCRMNRVAYTGTSSTSFTGCTNVKAHADNMYVRGESKSTGGCPFCSTFEYD